MAKKQSFDWTKLLMFAVPLTIAIGTYFVLQYRVEAAEKKLVKVEEAQEADDDKYHELQLEQRDIKAKVDQGYALLQEIRQEMKKK